MYDIRQSRQIANGYRLFQGANIIQSIMIYRSIQSALRFSRRFPSLLIPRVSISTTNFDPRLDRHAVTDLFLQYAQKRQGILCLDRDDIRLLRTGIGEDPADDHAVSQLFAVADVNGDGFITLEEFLQNAPVFLSCNPARIILVVGGPGSGKGNLCRMLVEQCNVVHLSSGEMLRDEVARQTPLGRQVQDIMARGNWFPVPPSLHS